MFYVEIVEIKFFGLMKFKIGMFNFFKLEDGKGNVINLIGLFEGFMIFFKIKYLKEVMEFFEFLILK